MAKGKFLELVRNTAELAATEAGCELVDVEYVKEGTNWYLRVYIDKEGGIMISDCEAVNRPISQMLDEKDPIEEAYFLEVSSPGLERPLKTEKDYLRAVDKEVIVKLYQAEDGIRQFEGFLSGLKDGIVTIKMNEVETKEIPLKSIAKIHLKLIL